MFDSDTNRRRDPEPADPNARSMMRFALLSGFSWSSPCCGRRICFR